MDSKFIEANGLRHHYLTQGTGPLVILCHGFPEIAYSWRHQIPAIAEAGFRVVAPDMRGYGDTKGPVDQGGYTNLHTVGDMVALVSAFGEKQAVIFGHDWGSPIAWLAATLRPDIFRAVGSLSIMHGPRAPMSPTATMRAAGLNDFYWIYFQTPGVAEVDMEKDTRETFYRMMYSVSGEAAAAKEDWNLRVKPTGIVDSLIRPKKLPKWLTEADLEKYASTYKRVGFTTSLNWYRNMDRNWELSAAWGDVKITVPALFIGGKGDPTMRIRENPEESLRKHVPGLRRAVILDNAGHWLSQEAPEAVNHEMIAFLKAL